MLMRLTNIVNFAFFFVNLTIPRMELDTPDKISHIYKNIYISNYLVACDINKLNSHNIKAILYLGSKNKSSSLLNLYSQKHISHKFLETKDTNNMNISQHFDDSWDFINTHIGKNHNILIHCMQGISRSPTIVAYYLTREMHSFLKSKKKKYCVLDDILLLIQLNRPCSNPNKNFINQLRNYEKQIMQK